MTAIYAYEGPGGNAARHLVRNSALQNVATVEYIWYAGADCTKFTPPPWLMSEGEQTLWFAAETFANGDGLLDVGAASRTLDAGNLEILVEALTIFFGIHALTEATA